MAEQAVRKMALVPADFLKQHMRPVDQQLSGLDEEMNGILQLPGVAADVKMKLYEDALTRYTLKRKQADQPIQVPIKSTAPPPPVQGQDAQPVAEVGRPAVYGVERAQLLRHTPGPKQQAVETLMDFVERTPGITFNNKKELVVNGQAVVGSNAIDLLQQAVRDKSMTKLPPGWNAFFDLLVQHNVPKLALGNRYLNKPWKGRVVAPPAATRPSPPTTSGTRRTRVFKATPAKGHESFRFVSLNK